MASWLKWHLTILLRLIFCFVHRRLCWRHNNNNWGWFFFKRICSDFCYPVQKPFALWLSVPQVMSEVNPLSDDWFHSVASQFELLCCCALLWLLPEAETSNAQEDHCSVIGHLFLVQDLQLVKAHDCIELGVPLWKAWSVFIYLAFFMFALSGVLFCFVFNNLCSPDLGKTMYKNILKVNGWILSSLRLLFFSDMLPALLISVFAYLVLYPKTVSPYL